MFWGWLVWQGVAYDKEYRFDLLGYSLALLAFILFIWQIHELNILVQFIKPELGLTIYLDTSTKELFVTKKGEIESIPLKNLDSLILSEHRQATRSTTAHLSYAQLNFTNREPILITSFLHNHNKLKDLLKLSHVKVTYRNRKLFEGILLR